MGMLAPWCSGYHVCLTRRRSRVRTSPEPHFATRILQSTSLSPVKVIYKTIVLIPIFE